MSQIIDIFLLPLLSGFLFIFTFRSLRYHFFNKNGFLLIFSCTLIGLGYFLLVYSLSPITKWILNSIFGEYEWWLNSKIEIFKIWDAIKLPAEALIKTKDGSDLSYFSFLSSIFICVIFFSHELFDFHKDKKKYRHINEAKITQKELNFFKNKGPAERTMARAVSLRKLIVVTLKSRKTYIGFLTRFPSPISSTQRESFTLFPFLSGFRDQETLEFCINNNYIHFYEALKKFLKPNNIQKYKNTDQIKIIDPSGKIEAYEIKFGELNFLYENMSISFFMDEIETVAIWTGHITGFKLVDSKSQETEPKTKATTKKKANVKTKN